MFGCKAQTIEFPCGKAIANACRTMSRAIVPALIASVLFFAPAALAETYKVSVGEMPATPIFLEILRSIEAANPGLKFDVTIAPFPRSVRATVEEHTADFHYPIIRSAEGASLPFDVSSATVFLTPFVLYENKNKPLALNNLYKYKIETERTSSKLFPFEIKESDNVSASLRKVDAGRIDGFIYGATGADAKLVEGGFKNIHRKLYAMMDICFVLPKGGKGGPVDQALTKAIETAKSTQAYKDAVGKYRAMYKGDDWQQ
jgi:polar amino acid transport system substrate-binding protein